MRPNFQTRLLSGFKTANFSYSQLAGGFSGYFDTVTNAARHSFFTSAGHPYGDWTGWISGSRAILQCGGGATNPMEASIDNGPWLVCQRVLGLGSSSAQVCTLFDGMADTLHLVRIRCASAFNNNAWLPTSGTVITVTGANPALNPFCSTGVRWSLTDPSFPGKHTFCLISKPAGANVAPTYGTTGYSSVIYGGQVKIRAQCSEIWVRTGDRYGQFAIDGGIATWLRFENNNLGAINAIVDGAAMWRRVATGLDATAMHDYYIATGCRQSLQLVGTTDIAIFGPSAAFGTLPATKIEIQYGDSLTEAHNYAGTDQANSDLAIYQSAPRLNGAIAAGTGVAGINVATLDTNLAAYRALRNIVEDIAVIAIGRNDGSTASAAFKTSYDNIIGALLTAGVGKIICRGCNIGGTFSNRDADIQAVVTARANANIVFVATTGWTPIDGVTVGGDATHPTTFGYTQMAGYEYTDYGATGFF